ncbi:hypothetical protein GUJ93_ZPchr0006g44954 [Zizania palustris]|uniref:Uncharacterized protein n=1 Tax=Zizania palustris TaxID=103762 RepID=A0A8J5T2X5_ZIZPA|nr:hypothetical protein GUJ93_ZPchr0006g44954 [Zizania palustris]
MRRPLLGLCAFVCAVVLVASLAPPGEEMAVMPSLPAASASTSLPPVGRRLLLPAARSRRFRPRRWNSAGIDDSKHEFRRSSHPFSISIHEKNILYSES